MTELFDLNSLKVSPTCFIEITDGASSGLIDTERSFPTTSNCGTTVLPRAMMTIQPRMIGRAKVRMKRGRRWRVGFPAGPDVGMASVVGSESDARWFGPVMRS